MVHCAVPMCETNSEIDTNLSFHPFPCDDKKLQLWLKNIIKLCCLDSEWKPNQYSTICSLHFIESDFKTLMNKKVLKSDAVPTIFSSSYEDAETIEINSRKRNISETSIDEQTVSDEQNMESTEVSSEHGQNQATSELKVEDSDAKQDGSGFNSKDNEAVSNAEEDEIISDVEQDQDDCIQLSENDQAYSTSFEEKPAKKARVDSARKYDVGSRGFHTPRQLKKLIRESKMKCAEKKLAIVKEKLTSKVVTRAFQKALVVAKIKAETSKKDFYERKKFVLLQTKVSDLANEIPKSEENFQTLVDLKNKIMEEELATRIEERAFQKELFEAEMQASNEKQTYYITKKTYLPIFMDHSNK